MTISSGSRSPLDRRAPSSIPVTVRGPVWARNSQASAVKVWKVRAVKQGASPASNPATDGSRVGMGISGSFAKGSDGAVDALLSPHYQQAGPLPNQDGGSGVT